MEDQLQSAIQICRSRTQTESLPPGPNCFGAVVVYPVDDARPLFGANILIHGLSCLAGDLPGPVSATVGLQSLLCLLGLAPCFHLLADPPPFWLRTTVRVTSHPRSLYLAVRKGAVLNACRRSGLDAALAVLPGGTGPGARHHRVSVGEVGGRTDRP